MMNHSWPVVALHLTLSGGYVRDVYRGIFGYLRLHNRPFRVVLIRGFPVKPPLRVAGVIALVTERRQAARVTAFGVPAINVSGSLDEPGMPTVRADDEAIGVLAAEHLMAAGYTRFASFEQQGSAVFRRRGDGFVRRLAAAGHACDRFRAHRRFPTDAIRERDYRRLCHWLRHQPAPFALLCGTDWNAGVVYEAAEELGLRIGTDLAVLGVDNDEFLCEAADPPLSSVDVNAVRVGHDAAALMTRFLRGQPPPRKPLLVPPVGVVQRQSTSWLAVADPAVASVLRFIHDHAHEPLTVARLLPVAAVSRRLLERRFRACMGRSILEEIHRVKLDRVRERLAHSDHTLEQIAAACGFSQLSHLSALFHRETGQTLTDCRALLRRGRRFSRQRGAGLA